MSWAGHHPAATAAGGEDDRPFDDILQFVNVAGRVVLPQMAQLRLRKLRGGGGGIVAVLAKEMFE